jgi:hypothetical protein
MKPIPPTIAFLQNPWFPPDTRKEAIDRYTTGQDFHRRLLGTTMSGRRLRQAFGDVVYGQIHWDNVAPAASHIASGVTEVDMLHVERSMARVKPIIILTFGVIARDALKNSIYGAQTKMFHCHHPNARHKTLSDLQQFALRVQQYVDSL